MSNRFRIFFVTACLYCVFSTATTPAGKCAYPLEWNGEIQPLWDELRLGRDSVEDLAAQEKRVIKELSQDPTQLFLRLRAEARKSAKGDFKYHIFEPVLRRILLDLRSHLETGLAVGQDAQEASRAIAAGLNLLKEGIPYRKTIHYIFQYTEVLDRLFLNIHPAISGRFHRKNAEASLEEIIGLAPDTFLFPTFEKLDLEFFIRSRSSPFHVVGLLPEGIRPGEPIPHIDGFDMMPSEFAWHDIGHIKWMIDRDFKYFRSTFKPIERIVQEWDLTRERILAFMDSYHGNRDRYDALVLLLFEILHERGYQYSFSVLKAELDTPKWTEILRRKKFHGYFQGWGLNEKLFNELEAARQDILRFVDEERRGDQINHARALRASRLAQRVTHYPKIEYGIAPLREIEIMSPKDIEVVLGESDSPEQRTHMEHMILAQVAPTTISPLPTPEAEKRLRAVLRMKAQSLVFVENSPNYFTLSKSEAGKASWLIRSVRIGVDRRVRVVFTDSQKSEREMDIESMEVPESFLFGNEIISNEEIFDINRCLGAHERNQNLHFTLHTAATVYYAKVELMEGEGRPVLVDGRPSARLTLMGGAQAGTRILLPLSEILIDPPQATDFDRPEFQWNINVR